MGIIFVIGVSLVIVWWRHQWKIVIAGLCLIFIVTGMYRYWQVMQEERRQNTLRFYNDYEDTVVLKGVITGEPDERMDKIIYKVLAQSVEVGETKKEVKGKVLVTLGKYPRYYYGDSVEFNGNINTPKSFPSFDYKSHLERQGIYSVMYYPKNVFVGRADEGWLYTRILSIKGLLQDNINKMLSEPYSSFLSALLLGTKKQIPDDLLDAFDKTGTTHIVAISGYNIALIAIFVTGILLAAGIHRYWAFWLAVLGIIFFTVLTGAGASVVRASIMGILVLIADRIGRLNRVTNALVFSGTVMVFAKPQLLIFDIGFQLSFMATLGLILWVPVLEQWLRSFGWKEKTMRFDFINSYGVPTFAAQILVVPIVAYNFGRISLVSVVANLIILPIIPLSMMIGFMGVAASFIFLPLAKVIGYVVWMLLYYEMWVIRFFANLPGASVELKEFSWIWVLVYYLVCIALYLGWRSKSKNFISA